jgi:hypothetical protein
LLILLVLLLLILLLRKRASGGRRDGAGARGRGALGVHVRRGRALAGLGCVLRRLAGDLGRRDDVDLGVGRARGDLLAALLTVPVGLLEPVEDAGQRGEADADEAQDGTGDNLESCTLRLDAGAGALLAELAVDVFGSLAQEVQRRDLLVGAVVLHRGLAHGLHADRLGVTWRRDGGRGAGQLGAGRGNARVPAGVSLVGRRSRIAIHLGEDLTVW